jgi:hypothetical protein
VLEEEDSRMKGNKDPARGRRKRIRIKKNKTENH